MTKHFKDVSHVTIFIVSSKNSGAGTLLDMSRVLSPFATIPSTWVVGAHHQLVRVVPMAVPSVLYSLLLTASDLEV